MVKSFSVRVTDPVNGDEVFTGYANQGVATNRGEAYVEEHPGATFHVWEADDPAVTCPHCHTVLTRLELPVVAAGQFDIGPDGDLHMVPQSLVGISVAPGRRLVHCMACGQGVPILVRWTPAGLRIGNTSDLL